MYVGIGYNRKRIYYYIHDIIIDECVEMRMMMNDVSNDFINPDLAVRIGPPIDAYMDSSLCSKFEGVRLRSIHAVGAE